MVLDLIHKERMSLLPYIATRGCPQARRTLYDLVKMGLVDFINDLAASGKVPTDEDLLRQSRQICYAIDNATDDNRYSGATWFRDLLFHEVKDHKFREVGSSSLDTMYSPGKQHPEERKLKDFVNSCKQLGIVPTESQLQMNALRILADLECTSSFRCNAALSWFKFLITSSNKWLRDFRLRTQLLYCPDMPEDVQGRGSDFPAAIDRIQRSSLLSLVDYAVQQDSNYHITEPVQWSTSTENTSDTLHWDIGSFTSAPKQLMGANLSLQRSPAAFDCQALPLYPKAAQNMQNTGYSSSKSANFQTYSFSDANCYRRLTHELGRFVSSCISDSNPARHWPSDEEIQRQARWIIFDDDDPWNQTAADHPEWLASFKRDVGLT